MFAFGAPGFLELATVAVFALLFVWPVCRIVGKTGFHPLFGILILVPIGNLALVLFLAFADWPALRGRNEEGPLR
jgi:hypothetical protein